MPGEPTCGNKALIYGQDDYVELFSNWSRAPLMQPQGCLNFSSRYDVEQGQSDQAFPAFHQCYATSLYDATTYRLRVREMCTDVKLSAPTIARDTSPGSHDL